MLRTTNVEILFIKKWFTDKNSKQLELEDNFDMKLIIR